MWEGWRTTAWQRSLETVVHRECAVAGRRNAGKKVSSKPHRLNLWKKKRQPIEEEEEEEEEEEYQYQYQYQQQQRRRRQEEEEEEEEEEGGLLQRLLVLSSCLVSVKFERDWQICVRACNNNCSQNQSMFLRCNVLQHKSFGLNIFKTVRHKKNFGRKLHKIFVHSIWKYSCLNNS